MIENRKWDLAMYFDAIFAIPLITIWGAFGIYQGIVLNKISFFFASLLPFAFAIIRIINLVRRSKILNKEI